ncbi:MAG: tail fiber domain-containing protein, partial [Bdellovibrionota bacterium]
GTTSPLARLYVTGGAIAAGSIGSGTGNAGQVRFYDLGASGNNYVAFRSPDQITSDVVYTLPGTLAAAGSVLGTDAAGSLSWVTASGGGNGDFMKDGSVTMTGSFKLGGNTIYGDGIASGTLTIDSTSNSTKGVIALAPTSGFVGIGTAAPGAALDVRGKSGNFPMRISSQAGAYSMIVFDDTSATQQFVVGWSNASSPKWQNSGWIDVVGAYPLLIATNDIERMRVDSNGNVGIGTNNPGTMLDVRGKISANTGTNGAPGFTFVGDLDTGMYSMGANTLAFSTAGTLAVTITNLGNVSIGTLTASQKLVVSGNVLADAYLYTSDRRLKTDIRDIDGLETVLAMRGVHFKWKKNGENEFGLIAQEIEEVAPDLVVTDPV